MAGDTPFVSFITQAGVESTPGSAVPATKRFPHFRVMMGDDGGFADNRSSGSIFVEQVIPGGDEHGSGSIDGDVSFTDIVYLLSSLVRYHAPTGDGTNGYMWDFTPNPVGGDVYKTYTLETGDANNNIRWPYAVVSGLGFKFSKKEAKLSGDILSLAPQVNPQTSGGVTTVTKQIVIPRTVELYWADTMAGLATGTKVPRLFEVEFKISNRYVPIYQMDANDQSFCTIVQAEPDVTMSLKLGARVEAPPTRAPSTAYTVGQIVKPTTDNGYFFRCTTAGTSAAGGDPTWNTTVGGTTTDGTVVWTTIIKDWQDPVTLADMREGVTNYFRIKAVGPKIGSNAYLFQLDAAVQVNQPFKLSNEQNGVLGVGWQFRVVNDATAGYPFKIQIRNLLAGL